MRSTYSVDQKKKRKKNTENNAGQISHMDYLSIYSYWICAKVLRIVDELFGKP